MQFIRTFYQMYDRNNKEEGRVRNAKAKLINVLYRIQ